LFFHRRTFPAWENAMSSRLKRAEYLDRLTARFSYGVIGLTILIFAGQGIRFLIQSGAFQ
jgi:hypothetical protein